MYLSVVYDRLLVLLCEMVKHFPKPSFHSKITKIFTMTMYFRKACDTFEGEMDVYQNGSKSHMFKFISKWGDLIELEMSIRMGQKRTCSNLSVNAVI